MKYAFKMMAVVFALGVLVLQGCITSTSRIAENATLDWMKSYGMTSTNKTTLPYSVLAHVSKMSDTTLCINVTSNIDNKIQMSFMKEAKRRGLDCSLKQENKNSSFGFFYYS